jgi:hypothetical protein
MVQMTETTLPPIAATAAMVPELEIPRVANAKSTRRS